ncbi:PKD domain-containing protein [Microbacterium gorillae]|uniref:PKD domain-containing protein n=1 Tax=Microbacterium gorillae TaxID=1231063 RepID=UPI0006944688|nr:PKD domain-containing protein [Microbacterium gorillae]
MSAAPGRLRRLMAAGVTALMFAVGLTFLPVTAASAAVPTTKAPLLERDDSVVTADALPTLQINDGYVWAQTTIGTTVYAVGSFSGVRPAGAAAGTGTVARSNVLAYDITTGALNTSFAPTVNGVVKSVAASPDGSRIYIGGSFSSVNGQTRWSFAALDAKTGALVSGFSPSVGGSGVYGIAVTGSTVYVGGLFTQANGVARKNLAAFDVTNGALMPWAPTTDLQVDAMVIEPGTGNPIAAGRFYAVNSQVQRGLVALDPTSGAILTDWAAPKTVINGWNSGTNAGKAGIFGLATDASGVYGTGWVFADVATGNLEGTFAADAGSGAIRWVADCHGDHYGIYSTGKTVYSTSHTHACETVNLAPEQDPRTYRYIEAVTADARGTLSRSAGVSDIYKDWSGTPSPSAYAWYPDFTVGNTSGLGQAGLSITGAGDFISVAGEFGTVNGQAQQAITRFSTKPATGAKQGPRITTSWTPTAASQLAGIATVRIAGNWDRDDLSLTYDLLRAGTATPVATRTVDSTWWSQPTVALTDTTATPGSTQSYTVRVKDKDGNTVTSSAVSVTIASGTTSAYGAAVLSDGPSDYWRMGTDTVNVAGGPAISYGLLTSRVAGAISETGSYATSFSGSSSSRASTSTSVVGPQTYSTESWFKTNTSRGGKIVGFGSSSTGSSSSYDRHVYMTNAGKLIFGAYDGATRTVTSPASYNDNAWHHVVATQDASGMKLYVDGALVGSDATATVAQSFTGYWRIGGDSIGSWPSAPSSQWFTGAIDDVAIYPQALTADQVMAHYAIGRNLQLPTAAFTPTATDLSVAFDASGSSAPSPRTISSYTWDFGDSSTGTGASPSHTYAAAGTYTVTLTVTDSTGLSASASQTLTVLAPNVPPTASFTSTVSGLTASVNGAGSSDSDGTVVGYSWDFGDGSAAVTTPTAQHAYATAGTYTVTLTVTDDRGATGTKTADVTVAHAAPVAQFTATPAGLSVAVDAGASTASDGATLSYAWDYGDGTTGTGKTASHTYDAAGSHTITLTLTDSAGGTASATQEVSVSAVVYAAADEFSRSVTSGWGTADTGGAWTAMYGAASAASVANGVGTMTLAAGQTRNMTLSGVSLTDSASRMSFTVASTPASGSGYVGLVSRQTATQDYTLRAWMRNDATVWLVAQASGTVISSVAVSGLTWAAGDTFTLATEVTGTSPTTVSAKIWKASATEPTAWQLTKTDATAALQAAGSPSVHVARAGSATSAYSVSVDDFTVRDLGTATNPAGNQAPTASFTATPTDLSVAVDASASSDPEGTALTYAWDFGDGSAAGSGKTATHVYTAAGEYTVKLTVTDAGGATGSTTQKVTVTAPATNAAPTASFTATPTDLSVAVDASASSDPEGTALTYAWDFGDGSAAGSGKTATHVYTAAGEYTVKLTVTDAGGATGSTTQKVTVTAPASAAIASDDFSRTTSAGWGTAPIGGAWTVQYGAASALSTDGSVGRVSIAAGQTRNMLLSSVSAQDVRITTKLSLAEAPAEGASYAGVVARQTATDNYQVRVWLRNDATVWLVTQHGSTVLNAVQVPGITRAAGDTYTLVAEVVGDGTTTIRAKLYPAGGTEPTAWQVTSTDATVDLQVAGAVGLHANRGGAATTNGTFTFDDFSVVAAQ